MHDYITLNIDGEFHLSSSPGSSGGVIRNHDGTWLAGFNRHLGFTSLLHSELWGIFDGLCLAWNLDFKKVHTYHLITSAFALSSSIALVRMIAGLLSRPWLLNFNLIKREANSVADHLAKLETDLDDTVNTLHHIPPSAHSFLHRDIHGPHI
ncbi:hypothetical protein F3Y22_tig00002840pilonHSYRG00881 [Hibiscus syriacus]|uniref:RNase H type-1 domain-containing protein n=1 Tax=Hibiscus syriacus TaxID=106335 RepID=A0A6A3CQQ0_HIBSY|nr:hypothetical protein F3Y22_tig00002840pilonHSYRG00881 [Hibiscus syriacus]